MAIPYLDDYIIYSESIEDHRNHLTKILNKIKGAGLVLNGEKCRFFKTEIEYLGHWISEGRPKESPNNNGVQGTYYAKRSKIISRIG